MKSGEKAYRLRAVTGVWIATMIFLVVAMLGWAMDTSYVAYVGQQLQVAADAASLAGAAQAKTDLLVAQQQAQATADKNTAGVTAGVPDPVLLELNEDNLPEGDIVTGRFYRWEDPISGHLAGDFVETVVLGEVNAVKAVAWRAGSWGVDGKLPLLFGPIFGVNTTNLSRDAIAMVTGTTGAGLIVLCPDCKCALNFGGNTDLTLTTTDDYDGPASIVVDSNATGCSPPAAAVCGSGGALNIDAPEINMVAEGPESSCWAGNPVLPPLNPGSPFVPDPLAGLPEPTINEAADLGCIGGAGCDTMACQGGLSDGIHCLVDADCPPDPGTCGPTLECNGGPNVGVACATDAECAELTSCDPMTLTCTAGPNAGKVCASDAECPNWSCNVDVMTCIDGPLLGAPCVDDGDCTNSGACGGAMTACNGGTNNGYACMDHSDCPGGLCWAAPTMCHEGDNPNVACLVAGDCPNGSCVPTVWARPGYYSGGFRIDANNVKLILDSGVYSLDNLNGLGPDAGLVISGGHFDARSGVMLHIIRDGIVHLGGTGDIEISPIITPGDIYEGVSIFQSRTNFNEAVIIGTTNMILLGTYYFPNNPVDIGGEGIAVGNELIAWTLYLHGNGEYTIAYDGRNPAPGYKVFLVD